MANETYPGIALRVKAFFIDGFAIVLLILLISDTFARFDTIANEARVIAFVCVFFLYEPVLVSFFGGTFGHKIIGIRVRQEQKDKNINFPLALLRFGTKALLGWLSYLTVNSSDKRQTIHDSLASSIVVFDTAVKKTL